MAQLLSSGFPIQQPTRQRIGLAADAVRAGGNAGHHVWLDRRVDRRDQWRLRLQLAGGSGLCPDVFVAEMQTTKASVSVTDLDRGGNYDLQVIAVGPAGTTELRRLSVTFALRR